MALDWLAYNARIAAGPSGGSGGAKTAPRPVAAGIPYSVAAAFRAGTARFFTPDRPLT